mmetsp:Transcript_10427/g.15800  ORF Transcript_10427/g.15800 Transcript_10427/m.15800 type:complete len:81 (+) Transcript_10427:263-505(+)
MSNFNFFTGANEVFNNMVFGSLVKRQRRNASRLKKEPPLKGKTRQIRATQHRNYGYKNDKVVGSYDGKVFWTLVQITWKE